MYHPGEGVGGEGRSLDVTREKEGDGLRGGVVLNTRPYENWQEHWDKQKHPDWDTMTDDYVSNEFINLSDGIESTEDDPRKGFREQD